MKFIFTVAPTQQNTHSKPESMPILLLEKFRLSTKMNKRVRV